MICNMNVYVFLLIDNELHIYGTHKEWVQQTLIWSYFNI